MSNGYRIRFGTTAVLMVMVLSVLAAGACSNSNDEAVQLLEDPKIGLGHLNDEFHTIKGEERRLHDELEEQQGQMEQRIRELTALNNLFQQHMQERNQVVEAYRDLLKGLRDLPKGMQKLAAETMELVERAEAQPIPELAEVSLLEGEGGNSAAQQ